MDNHNDAVAGSFRDSSAKQEQNCLPETNFPCFLSYRSDVIGAQITTSRKPCRFKQQARLEVYQFQYFNQREIERDLTEFLVSTNPRA